ncbi:MAG: hypothetical protein ACRCU3_01860 [Eubacteriaceae bacterium]
MKEEMPVCLIKVILKIIGIGMLIILISILLAITEKEITIGFAGGAIGIGFLVFGYQKAMIFKKGKYKIIKAEVANVDHNKVNKILTKATNRKYKIELKNGEEVYTLKTKTFYKDLKDGTVIKIYLPENEPSYKDEINFYYEMEIVEDEKKREPQFI